jgi:hypothetical protein
LKFTFRTMPMIAADLCDVEHWDFQRT